MNRPTRLCLILFWFTLMNMGSPAGRVHVLSATEIPTSNTGKYLDYSTFIALVALVPEVQQPRLAGGTTEAGYQLWAQGQMRIPADHYFVEGDFAQNGRREGALLFTGTGQYYLLIAEQHGEQWLRQALFQFQAEVQLAWDGIILRLGPPSMFIRWDGQEFYLSQSHLDVYAYDYTDAEFKGVLVKLTYIGPQNEPLPGLLISSYYRLPTLNSFKPYRRSDVNYGNDDIPDFWHITVSPKQLHDLILTIHTLNSLRKIEKRSGHDSQLSFSLSVVDTTSVHRPNPYELLLTTEETSTILHSVGNDLQQDNPAIVQLFKEYLLMFGESGGQARE